MVEALPEEVFKKYEARLRSDGFDAGAALSEAYEELGVKNFDVNPVMGTTPEFYYYAQNLSAEGMLLYIKRLLEASVEAHNGLDSIPKVLGDEGTGIADSMGDISRDRHLPLE